MEMLQLSRIDFAVEMAEKAGTSVVIPGEQARELLDHLVTVIDKCNALQAENAKLRATAADHLEFINWIQQEIDDYDLLCRIVKRAQENPSDMNKDCERSVDIFLQYVRDDVNEIGCDHETGVCNCQLKALLTPDA